MSQAFVQLLIGNIAVAGLLGIAAWICARRRWNPSLAHALYALALIKLVTPSPIAVSVLPAADVTTDLPLAAGVDAPASLPHPVGAGDGNAATGSPAAAADSSPGLDASVAWSWWDAALIAWWLGSISIAAAMLWRLIAFRRALRLSRPASRHVLHEVDAMCTRVGLRRTPRVLTTTARVSPLVFPGIRGASLLLPTPLLERLGADERGTLLLHELAHLRRRDHWMRWLEVAVVVSLWWLPLAWWLRAGMRQAEEECCDAWVAGVSPDWREAYCRALLAVVDYLAHAPVRLPAHACGVGRVLLLERRLENVMLVNSRIGVGRGARAGLVAVAVVALALTPAAATSQQGAGEPAPRADNAAVARTLESTEIQTAFEEASISDWCKFYVTVSGVPFVISPATKNLPARRTTLRDFSLPKMSVRRALDVIGQTTDLRWRIHNGIVRIDPAQPGAAAPKPVAHVLGAASKPGRYALQRDETLLEVLGRAGFGNRSNLRSVLLIRPDPTEPLTLDVDVRKMLLKGDTTQNVMLRDGDVIVLRPLTSGKPETLRVGDRLRFLVDPDAYEPGGALLKALTDEQTVDSKGRILVPYVGRIPVAGLDEEAVEKRVRKELQVVFKHTITLYARFSAR